MRPKWTAQQVEIAVTQHFNPRRYLIVPNVSFGLFNYHEADMVILAPSNWGTEVEIKVTAADIKADLKKWHQRKEKIIRDVWFAVPEELAQDQNIPSYAGIISVRRWKTKRGKQRYFCERKRLPEKNKDSRKFTDIERNKLLRLGCLRILGLKEKLDDKSNKIEELKQRIRELELRKDTKHFED
jgi:hypothetical protein